MTDHRTDSHQAGDDADFGQWLRGTMDRAGFTTPAELARTCAERGDPIAGSMLSRWLNGEARPAVDKLRIIAQILGVPLLEALVQAGHLTRDEAGISEPTVLRVPVDPVVEGINQLDLPAEERAELIRLRQTLAGESDAFFTRVYIEPAVDAERRKRSRG